MKSLKSKLIAPIIALTIATTSLFPQNLKAQESEQQEEWNGWIGTCGIYPNDTDLRKTFESYLGVQAKAQKKLKDDLYLAVNGTMGFGKASSDDYTLKARQTELSGLILYKSGRFEAGGGPVLSMLNLIGESGGDREEESYSGVGLGGRMKYKVIDGKKVDISVMGAYSKVRPSDEDIDLELGTTKLGLILEF